MSLVRHPEDVDLTTTAALDCSHCGTQHTFRTVDDLYEMSDDDTLRCTECRLSGFIPRRKPAEARERPVEDRWPAGVGAEGWTPVPFSLLALNEKTLSTKQRMLVIALESFRRAGEDWVWPSQQSLSDRSGIPLRTLPRVMDDLLASGWLLRERERSKGGRWLRYRYSLAPFWRWLDGVSTDEEMRCGYRHTPSRRVDQMPPQRVESPHAISVVEPHATVAHDVEASPTKISTFTRGSGAALPRCASPTGNGGQTS